MKEKHIQIFSIVLSIIYAIFIVWIYAYEPKSFNEAVTKATVTVGTYQIDKAKFDEGLRLFRAENYPAARELFNQADSEKRDSRTQFYLAYSFYRQGWGRISNNNQLFQAGLETLNRVEPTFKADDENLQLKTPAELRNEFAEGIKVTADDFNPLKVLRERK
jgi:isopenicillin N synthase-like dioxygenase